MSYGASRVDKLIMQVEGEAELKRATAELEAQRKAVDNLIEAKKRYSPSLYAQEMQKEVAALRSVQDEVNQLTKQFGRTEAFKAQGVNQLAYAIQDFTATSGGFAQKLNSVTNNMQVFAASLGVGGAWFIGITTAMQAIQLIANNWSSFSDYLNGVDPAKAEAMKKRAEEAQKKAEEVAKSLEKMASKEKETPQAKEGGEIFTAAVAQSGGVEKIQKDLAGQYSKESIQADSAYKELQRSAAAKDAADAAVAAAPKGSRERYSAIGQAKAAAQALADAQARVASVGQEMNDRANRTIDAASKGDAAARNELGQRFPYTSIPQATDDAIAQQEAEDADFLASTETTPDARNRRRSLAYIRSRSNQNRNDFLGQRADDRADQARKDAAAAKRLADQRARDQEDIRAVAAKAQFEQYRDADVGAQERAINGGFTGDETATISNSFALENRARLGQASLSQIQEQLQQNRAAMDSIDQAGGFGSTAYQAFVDTSSMLMQMAQRLRAIQIQQQQMDMQFQAGRATVRTQLNRGF